MSVFNPLFQLSGPNLFGLAVAAIWTIIWQGLALWHAARNNQRNWFIAVLIFNTAGLLPIIYLIWYKPQQTKLKKKSQMKLSSQSLSP